MPARQTCSMSGAASQCVAHSTTPGGTTSAVPQGSCRRGTPSGSALGALVASDERDAAVAGLVAAAVRALRPAGCRASGRVRYLPSTLPGKGALGRISLPPLGRCVNALAQLGSAANLVSSLGYMAAADGGSGHATRAFGAAGTPAIVESLDDRRSGRGRGTARHVLPRAWTAPSSRQRTNAGPGCPRLRVSPQV